MKENELTPKDKRLTFKEIGQDFIGKFLKIVRKESIESPLDGPENEIFFIQKTEEDENIFGYVIENIQDNPAKLLIESTDWRKFLPGSSYYFTPLNDTEKGLVAKMLTKGWEKSTKQINEIINNL